jgi:hypothetical protein
MLILLMLLLNCFILKYECLFFLIQLFYIIVYCIRYRIKVRVIDSTDSAIFVIFDRDGVELFNMACAEIFMA